MGLFDEMLEGQREYFTRDRSAQGVMLGIVKENWNKDYPGMVKVEIITGEKGENLTDWVPVMVPYGGAEYGAYSLPEVGAEVVLAFLTNQVSSPIVIGCLWNKDIPIPKETADEKNTVKTFITKGGNRIRISDEKGKEKIEIHTTGKLNFVMEDESKTIVMSDEEGKNKVTVNGADGLVELTAEKKMALKVGGNEMLLLEAGGNSAAVKAGQINVEASQSLKMKGQSTTLEGNTLSVTGQSAKMEGNMLTLSGKGTLKAESSGITEVKGSMVKIN